MRLSGLNGTGKVNLRQKKSKGLTPQNCKRNDWFTILKRPILTTLGASLLLLSACSMPRRIQDGEGGSLDKWGNLTSYGRHYGINSGPNPLKFIFVTVPGYTIMAGSSSASEISERLFGFSFLADPVGVFYRDFHTHYRNWSRDKFFLYRGSIHGEKIKNRPKNPASDRALKIFLSEHVALRSAAELDELDLLPKRIPFSLLEYVARYGTAENLQYLIFSRNVKIPPFTAKEDIPRGKFISQGELRRLTEIVLDSRVIHHPDIKDNDGLILPKILVLDYFGADLPRGLVETARALQKFNRAQSSWNGTDLPDSFEKFGIRTTDLIITHSPRSRRYKEVVERENLYQIAVFNFPWDIRDQSHIDSITTQFHREFLIGDIEKLYREYHLQHPAPERMIRFVAGQGSVKNLRFLIRKAKNHGLDITNRGFLRSLVESLELYRGHANKNFPSRQAADENFYGKVLYLNELGAPVYPQSLKAAEAFRKMMRLNKT